MGRNRQWHFINAILGDIENCELHFWKMYVVIPALPVKLITPFEMVNVTGHYPNDQSRSVMRSLHYIWKAASPVLPIQPVPQGSNIRRNPAMTHLCIKRICIKQSRFPKKGYRTDSNWEPCHADFLKLWSIQKNFC